MIQAISTVSKQGPQESSQLKYFIVLKIEFLFIFAVLTATGSRVILLSVSTGDTPVFEEHTSAFP